jgi:hypothetical protein
VVPSLQAVQLDLRRSPSRGSSAAGESESLVYSFLASAWRYPPNVALSVPLRSLGRKVCCMRRSILLFLLAVGLVPSAIACPDLTGRYRIGYKSGLEPEAYRGILTALRMTRRPGGDLDLEISSSSDGRTMAVRLLASPTSPTQTQQRQPHATLSFGADYDCKDGVVSLLAPFDDGRKSDNGYLEGTTVVSMRRESGGGLAFTLQFTGVQRSTLYSYDSARISIPLPFTRRRLVETAEVMPAHLAPPPPDPVKLARKRAEELTLDSLASKVRGLTGASIGVKEAKAEGTLLYLRAGSTDQMLRIEDSLLTSDLPYEVVGEPYWAGSVYTFIILVRSERGGAVRRPSAFRVEKELDKLLCQHNTKGSHVVKTKRTGEDYEARVALQGGMTAAEAADCIAGRSKLISQALPVGTELQYDGSGGKREFSVWRVKVTR